MKLQVYTLDISPLSDDALLMQYKNCIAEDRAKRVKQYKAKADQARSIGAGILLAMAYEQFQKENGESAGADSLFSCRVTAYELTQNGIRIIKGENVTAGIASIEELCKLAKALPTEKMSERGKPYFEAGPYYNISHAQDMVVLAMATEDVGIDLERTRACKESVIKRCFTEDEIRRVHGAGCHGEQVFTQIWTQKEAAAKLTGAGLADILDKKVPDGIIMRSIWLDEAYVLTICMAGEK